jgi:putative addiction module component (TIGR02574 family)
MSKIEKAWTELAKLPENEQDVVADAILDYAAGGQGVELSDDQVAEVERRLAEHEVASLTITELRARLRKLGV